MRAILQKIEEFLSKRTLRERILVAIFLFISCFGTVFAMSFAKIQESFNQAKAKTFAMEEELAKLQEKQGIPILDNVRLKQEIKELESLIKEQNQKKERLQGKFQNFFVLKKLGSELESFFIAREVDKFLVSGSGDFESIFLFLREAEALQTFLTESFLVYPNQQRLDFFMTLKVLQDEK